MFYDVFNFIEVNCVHITATAGHKFHYKVIIKNYALVWVSLHSSIRFTR